MYFNPNVKRNITKWTVLEQPNIWFIHNLFNGGSFQDTRYSFRIKNFCFSSSSSSLNTPEELPVKLNSKLPA